jgi:FkbM family methyltransferase
MRNYGIRMLLKSPKYLYLLIRCFFLIKSPLKFIYHYLTVTSPRENNVELRTGLKIILSDNPVDVITVFVVFIREDYGKIKNYHNIVIDIGANIGVFSLYAAQNGAKKVYAFEPNGSAYDVLERNVAANKLCDVIFPYRFAVTDIDNSTVRFPLMSSPYNQIESENAINGDFEEVRTITLAGILDKNRIDSVDFLKIDCEGGEYEIFFGLEASVFLKVKEIRMEYHTGPNDKLIRCFGNFNFRIVHFSRDSRMLWVRRSLLPYQVFSESPEYGRVIQ